jgi:hypothetical protein
VSLLWRLLTRRAGYQELPVDIGEEEDDEPELPPQPSLHLTDEDFTRAAAALSVSEAVVRAVAYVEAAGRGFLPDGRPQVLYEAHVFHRETGGIHGAARDSRGRPLSVPRWDRSLYGAAGVWQHDGRLAPAAQLDWAAAHRATSFGLFQVMGFNHASVGHETIQSFVEAAFRGAGDHLDMFVKFVQANRLELMLRNRRWADFARRYNGPGYRQNNYDRRLAEAYRRFSHA